MRLFVAVLALLTSACATTHWAPRTIPVVDGTTRALPPLSSKSVLVVGPSTFQQVSADIGFWGASTFPSDLPSANPEPVALTLERELFEAGWTPLSQATIAKLLANHRTAVAIRELAVRGRPSLLEAALVLLPDSGADSVVLIRAWRLGWGRVPSIATEKYQLCPLTAELDVALYDRTGTLLWQGLAKTGASDFNDLSMTTKWREVQVGNPSYAVASENGCAACPTYRPDDASAEVLAAMAKDASNAVVKAIQSAR
jgi:hypothetical protein